MRVCPQCMKTSSRFQYNAWVLQVTGTMEEDTDGAVSQLGPMRASITIKKGKEFDGKSCQLSCPHCKYRGYKDEFKIVRPCVLTGGVGDASISTPVGILIVNSSVVDLASAVFTEERMNWPTEYRRDMELF